MSGKLYADWLPGLVMQFQRFPDGRCCFTYLSDGCHALLGMAAPALLQNATLFDTLILEDDRAAYHASMASSMQTLKAWNWEGRIHITSWHDIKWINLRSTPHQGPDGMVQWDGIITNITHSKEQEQELIHSRARLAELSAHVESVKEQERRRIAREIHDDVGGNLTAIKIAMALLVKRLPVDDAQLAQRASYIDTLIDRSIDAVHRIADDLRPGMLDFGLISALEWQAGEFEKQTGIPCLFSFDFLADYVLNDDATALFRIVQEALNNVSKHAQATQVKLQITQTERCMRLEISDNGRGISVADQNKPYSFGIRGMKERAHAMGGEFAVHRLPEGGSTVSIRIPLNSNIIKRSETLGES